MDIDGDGSVSSGCCNTQPSGLLLCGPDCDDGRASVNPSEVEVCNGLDDDCNGQIDDGVDTIIYLDWDGDGFGGPECGRRGCPGTDGFSTTAGDCNDSNAAIGPGDSTCGVDPTVLLVCTDGAWSALPCSGGRRCAMQPDGTGLCMDP
jgi:hypothetical protein